MTRALEQTTDPLDAQAAPPAAGAPPAAEAPPASLRSRGLFAWFVCWAVLLTIPLCLCLVVAHRFAPTAQTFKRWAGRWGRALLWGLGMRADVTQAAVLAPDQPYIFASWWASRPPRKG